MTMQEYGFKQAASGNYAPGRSQKIQYLVIHYTANNGDTAQNNLDYFARNFVSASAHYFVDENGYGQSVKDTDTAYHCGANEYVHPSCRNANSIGIELCSRVDSKGNYYFLDQTVKNAADLAKMLSEEYNIPVENIIRHYDVTGKKCPAPMVDNPALWGNFLDMVGGDNDMTEDQIRKIVRSEYDTIMAEKEAAPVSDYAKQAWEEAIEDGITDGTCPKSYITREQCVTMLHRKCD
jgi:N-acetylmuramoyl-L-alanine amidase CwlA